MFIEIAFSLKKFFFEIWPLSKLLLFSVWLVVENVRDFFFNFRFYNFVGLILVENIQGVPILTAYFNKIEFFYRILLFD